MSHILINNTNSIITLADLGLDVPANGQITVALDDFTALRGSDEILEHLRDGFASNTTGLTYSDGFIVHTDPEYELMDVMGKIHGTTFVPGNYTNSQRLKVAIAQEDHAPTHEAGGADVVNVNGLSGVLLDNQHVIPSEAVSAMGVLGNTNPLNHSRYQQSEITSLPENQLSLNHSTHDNSNDPSSNEKLALSNANSPNVGNPYATISDLGGYSPSNHTHVTLPTQNEKDAMTASILPSSSNRYLTDSDADSQYAIVGHVHTASDISDFDVEVGNSPSVSTNTVHRNIVVGNPHNVTKSEVGLSNVDNVQQVPLSSVGQANGVAPLNGSSLIPSQYLPASVDEVQEFSNLASFPGTGSAGIIYVALDTNKTHRWGGSSYTEISPSDVNSVNGSTGIVILDPDDLNDAATINKFVTQSQINNFHTHGNKAQLDLITDGDHDVRTDNPHGVSPAQIGAALSSHSHAWIDVSKSGSLLSDMADVPIKPNDGQEYLLQEFNGTLLWVLKSSISSTSKRTVSIVLIDTASTSNNTWLRMSDQGISTHRSSFIPPFDCRVREITCYNRNNNSSSDVFSLVTYYKPRSSSSSSIGTGDTLGWWVSNQPSANLIYNENGGRNWAYDDTADGDTMSITNKYAFRYERDGSTNDLVVTVLLEEL